jgi:hypothetical protein
MSKPTVSAAGGAMPDAEILPRKPIPAFESEVYLTFFQLCHHRLQALHKIAQGRGQPDDRKMVTGAESLLAMHGWTPKDFGFVDPPMFDVRPNTGTVFAALDATTVN